MNKLNAWIISFRLRTLPLSLSAIFAGSIIAARQGLFRWEVLIWASVTTLFLQILSNLSNDYGDAVSGADNDSRTGPKRMIQSGIITKQQMKKAMIVCALLSLVSGLVLLCVSFESIKIETVLFLIAGLAAIAAAIRYTVGQNPYGYRGLGDIYVFLFFGIAGVAGSFFLHGISWSWAALLPASTIGFFSMAVLNLNNIRDIHSDSESGKHTLVVKIGRDNASWYHFFLIMGGWLCFLIFTKISGDTGLLPICTLPLFIVDVWVVFTKNDSNRLNSELRNLSLTILLFVLLGVV
ncbi:MAG: 1,4-dihydroxy-2-naphthoate octaprenyltransferase [Cytophagaceae bacterium]|jgi:1,4-dihydroxy-2-naphthoate octaprenyltransferase|nr:1,4-dihydroxy-2-naphthoate octaprenyltransferase [Cytophagaceae bacterium]